MKLNEILLIGGALVAALVLSKGRGLSSSSAGLPFINPFTDLLTKVQAQTVQKLDTNIGTLESVRQSNLGIAQSILDYERSIKDVNISQINTELDKTQSYISQQQKIGAPSLTSQLKKLFGYGWTSQNLLNKFNTQTAYNQRVGRSADASIFPDIYVSNSSRGLVAAQLQYDTAQQNIKTANALVVRQSGEIDRLQEEYQTRYGNLSRYG